MVPRARGCSSTCVGADSRGPWAPVIDGAPRRLRNFVKTGTVWIKLGQLPGRERWIDSFFHALDGATSNHAFELHGSKALRSAIADNVIGPVNLNAIRSA